MNIENISSCPYYLITRVSLTITTALKKGFAESGIGEVKPAYLGALMCLWTNESMGETLGKFGHIDGFKINELGRCAGLEPSTMTGLIDRMEKGGLVYRAADPEDRRVMKVHLTDTGWNIREKALAVVDRTIKEVFDGIPEENLEVSKDVLRNVLINSNKVGASWIQTEK